MSYKHSLYVLIFIALALVQNINSRCSSVDKLENLDIIDKNVGLTVFNLQQLICACNLTSDLTSAQCTINSMQALKKMFKLVKWEDSQPVTHQYKLNTV